MRNTFAAIKLALLLSFGSLPAFSTVPLYATDLVEPLGDLKTLSGWSGLEPGTTLKVPGEAAFVYPNGPRGQFKHGFRVLNDSAAEWQNFYGVQFEANLPDAREVALTATIERARRGSSPETPVNGDEARFLTVIEPYEDKALVKSAVAVNADKLRVELTDGRVQEITLKNFDGSGKDIEAHIVETKDGQVLRQESTVAREAAAR
ncbi:MAG TPA: hypothetical protein DCQ92_09465 [Verrucomicrobia subdivision 3 bacterium]|nr:hypothetical protein [Limisphaerales bacterium]